MIFDIQRGCTHDGPGIRTVVFFKGCTLKCYWCQNPESHSFECELAYYRQKCLRCGRCISVCPSKALSLEQNGILIERSKCIKCGNCNNACLTGALKLIGSIASVKELTSIILKDLDFYNLSGGGVTFSGGECLANGLCLEVLAEMKRLGIDTAIETCGNVPKKNILAAAPLCNLFLFDIKTCDSKKHIFACGASNEVILENLQLLKKICPEKIQLRMCIVPGFNDNENEMLGLCRLASGLKKPELIPFHPWGKSKYLALDKTYAAQGLHAINIDYIEQLRRLLDEHLKRR